MPPPSSTPPKLLKSQPRRPSSPTPRSPSSTGSTDERRSRSFSLSGLKPFPKSDRATGTEEKSGGMKGLFSKLRRKTSSSSLSSSGKSPSSTGQSPSSTGTAIPSSVTPTSPPLLRVDTQPPPSSSYDASQPPKDADQFRNSVISAQKSVNRLEAVNTVLTGVAAGLGLGAGWLPGVGEGVKLIVMMLDQAKDIGVSKVAALRLVERCASVLTAVEQAVIDHKGQLSTINVANIERLLSNLHKAAYLVTKLSQRSFLKLYLHADDVARQIAKATVDLGDFVDIFQLQSSIATAAWEQQSQLDHKRDLQILVDKLDQGRDSDQAMLKILEMQNDEQQEAIKTLQRTVDALLAIQTREHNQQFPTTSRPGSPAVLDSPVIHPLPPILPRPRMDTLGPPISRKPSPEGEQVPALLASLRDIPSLWNAAPDEERQMRSDTVDEHRQFCERALDVLRRNSAGSDVGVPDWTITKLEVAHDERISAGFFSVIWKGRWNNQDVAIKELNSTADRTLFIKEVDVWRRLKSSYILPFLGASSTTGPPPWYLVSPYMANGNILDYLKSDAGQQADKIALIHQMARGMEYLHSRDIIHGDFKAANVLATDVGEAIICDFGLSRLKLDITTKSGEAGSQHALAGTMRWQSPERLSGGVPTLACDVYSFAMAVYELYTFQVPFGYVDDMVVQHNIRNGERPSRPDSMPESVWDLVDECWAQRPDRRLTFEAICVTLSTMYEVPPETGSNTAASSPTGSSTQSFVTAREGEVPEEQHAISPEPDSRRLPDVTDESSTSSGSIHSIPPHLENQLSFESDRAEKHYRHYLQHEFDDRLSLPLWFPSPIELGMVGYIRHGQFVPILDPYRLPTQGGELPPTPYLDEFSTLQTTKVTVNVRNAAERGLDMVSALTNFVRSSGEESQKAISRRVAFPLKPGMKQAALVVDDGVFEIYKSFAEARDYLTANVDWVLKHFGDSHQIAKEDVIIVVGTLTAHNYAMIVSNFAPRTTLSFNVHAHPELAEPWGTWSVDRQPPVSDLPKAFKGLHVSESNLSGDPDARRRPDVDEHELKFSARVSRVSASPMDAVILAKLKFPPGGTAPTLYP